MIRVFIFFVVLTIPVFAHEDHRWSTADRQWFKKQQIPGKPGQLCCNENDGAEAEEEIRGEHYWTRWPQHPVWMPVPANVVIYEPNRNGAPVVWWWYENGVIKIRCYAPGGGV